MGTEVPGGDLFVVTGRFEVELDEEIELEMDGRLCTGPAAGWLVCMDSLVGVGGT
jgi:hypothetical protein